MERIIIRKNSVVKIQNFVVNYESRPIKSNSERANLKTVVTRKQSKSSFSKN